MAKGVKFKQDSDGFRALLNGAECQAMLLSNARRVAEGAARVATYSNAAYDADVQPGRNRAHARVKSTTQGGYWSALKQKSLTAALGDARG